MNFACWALLRSMSCVQIVRSRLVLPDSPSANTSRCGSAPKSRYAGASSSSSIPMGTSSGCNRWCGWSCPCLGQPVRRIDDPRREVLGRGCGVDARQGGQHLQLVAGQAPAGSPLRDVGGDSSVHIGLGRVTETELDPRAQQVLQRGPDLSPPGTRDHQVHAVGQPLRAQVHHRLLKSLELGLERQPAVEHQKDMANSGGRRNDG
jgi:hypothetical protein